MLHISRTLRFAYYTSETSADAASDVGGRRARTRQGLTTVATPEHQSGQRADRRALAEINDLIDEGVYDAASVMAWEVQRTAPGDPDVWLLLARIDYIRERFAAAMYAARMATRLDPSSPEAWLALAMTSVTRSRWRTEGLDAALQATALSPDDVRAWIVLSQLHLQGGAPYEAAIAAERAVRVDASDRGGHLMLGEIALEAQEWAHAEAAFRRVLAIDGSDPHARAGLTEALEAQGVDPADELARYGDPPPHKLRRPKRNVPVLRSGDASRASVRASPTRVMALVIGGSLVVGLVAGLALPGLGVVRGLVAGAAVALMWFAVRPLRSWGAQAESSAERAPSEDRSSSSSVHAVRASDAATTDAAMQDTEVAGTEAADQVTAQAGARDTRPDDADVDQEATAGLTAAAVFGDASYTGGHGVPHDTTTASDGAAPTHRQRVVSSAGDPDQPGPDPAAAGRQEPTVDMPDDPDALAELSRERLAASDLELAHAAASRLEAVSPGTVEAHRALGAVALAERDYDQARHHYSKVLELEPLDQEAHERLALVSDDLGRAGPRFPLRGFRSRR